KCLRLRREHFQNKASIWAYNVRVLEDLPAGLRSFARSPSPDRAKNKLALCTLCLCGEQSTL
ncbi:MAG: hypothetical protein PVI73_15920, partial [Syntrophobacterales bacterium]